MTATKYKSLQYSHPKMVMCDLSSEEFKIAILNNSVCYRKYSKIVEQKQENNKQWTKQGV